MGRCVLFALRTITEENLMSFMLLLILALVSMQSRWPKPEEMSPAWLVDFVEWAGPLSATFGCLALVWTVGSLYTWLCCWAIRREPTQVRRLLNRFHARQRVYFLLMTCTFLGVLFLLGWGKFVSDLWWDENEEIFRPGRQLALLAPFLASLVCSWIRFYDPERTVYRVEAANRAVLRMSNAAATRYGIQADLKVQVRDLSTEDPNVTAQNGIQPDLKKQAHDLSTHPGEPPFLSRWAYLGLQVRFNLLLIVPPLFLMLLRETFLWSLPRTAADRMTSSRFSSRCFCSSP